MISRWKDLAMGMPMHDTNKNNYVEEVYTMMK